MRTTVRFLVGVLGAAILAAPAPASAATLVDNPWLERRVLNIAHQGGEIEAPSNTLFAFKTAKEKGADVLELDVHATADGHLVVIHDTTVGRTTNADPDGQIEPAEDRRIDQMTLAEVKALDAAYWYAKDCGTCRGKPAADYVYRGFATGERPITPELSEFEPNDFKIPTLREVLDAFPRDLINIEIKRTAPDTVPYEHRLAALLEEYGRTSDTIVVSFYDNAMELFKLHAPDVHTATGTGETGAFWASAQGPAPGLPNPRYQALQVPITFEGLTIVTPEFVERAHANGLAVHVWTIDDRPTMERLIDMGVDGIMTNRPTLLEEVVGAKHVKYRPPRDRR
jgi:glycerophosphoryl diester phosphodiesterase